MHKAIHAIRVFAFLAVVAPTRTARGAPADRYDAAEATARGAEARGDFAAAARTLRAVVDAYPQDYAIALHFARVLDGAGDGTNAERAYRVAIARAPASRVPRLELAWMLAREDRCDDARTWLAPLARDHAAEKVSVACDERSHPTIDVSTAFDAYAFPSHPSKTSGAGGFIGANAFASDELVIGGAYRYVHFATTQLLSPFSQNEGYARIGYESRRAGLYLMGAVVDDGSDTIGPSQHAGISARLSFAGDLYVDASASHYRDETVLRIAPAWSIPIAGPLSIIPSAAYESAAGQSFATAYLSMALRSKSASFVVGGKYGDEERPAYLAQSIVYDITERVAWGAWATLRFQVGGALWLDAAYSLDRLRRTDALSPSESDAHAFVIGPELIF